MIPPLLYIRPFFLFPPLSCHPNPDTEVWVYTTRYIYLTHLYPSRYLTSRSIYLQLSS